MVKVANQILNILKIFSPFLTLIITVVFAAGVIKWTKRVGSAFKEITSNPGSFLFWLIIVALTFWLFFKYLYPQFNQF